MKTKPQWKPSLYRDKNSQEYTNPKDDTKE